MWCFPSLAPFVGRRYNVYGVDWAHTTTTHAHQNVKKCSLITPKLTCSGAPGAGLWYRAMQVASLMFAGWRFRLSCRVVQRVLQFAIGHCGSTQLLALHFV
jgi:hypothetical protein